MTPAISAVVLKNVRFLLGSFSLQTVTTDLFKGAHGDFDFHLNELATDLRPGLSRHNGRQACGDSQRSHLSMARCLAVWQSDLSPAFVLCVFAIVALDFKQLGRGSTCLYQ